MKKPTHLFIASVLAGFTLACLATAAEGQDQTAGRIRNSLSVLSPAQAGLKMEILLALSALGVAAYLLSRNMKWGLECVRSQVFLSGLHARHTVSDA
jgi:hypothetical protein